MAANPGLDSQNWRLALKLPTKKLDGTQTVQLHNDASLVGSKNGIEFVSKTDSYATTWGDELEVRKSATKVQIIRNPKLEYYGILRAKLHWGER
mgnify:CR=1 FL=1